MASFSSTDPICAKPSEPRSKESRRAENICLCLTPQWQVYISHFLSSWGDRMWMFAGGLFLIEITPGSLRLVAVFEVAQSLTVILLGAAVGRWVDRTSRLTAAQLSLVLQNAMVCLCTLLLCLIISYRAYFMQAVYGWGDILSQVGVVGLACLAQLGTLGSKIAIEKDWIVIISEDSGANLATMNSVLRTVDLSSEMVAPVLVGFVMTSWGAVTGGVVIASWNVASLAVEYGLLHALFHRVAALRKPKRRSPDEESCVKEGSKPRGFLVNVRSKVKDSVATWRLYWGHAVRDAGLALGYLYMTVLALDNYSRVYVYESGVSKAILGILTACASVCGILGSVCFPVLKKKFGLLRTGVFGFSFESCCLLLCAASVFLPGTRFGPFSTTTTKGHDLPGPFSSTTTKGHDLPGPFSSTTGHDLHSFRQLQTDDLNWTLQDAGGMDGSSALQDGEMDGSFNGSLHDGEMDGSFNDTLHDGEMDGSFNDTLHDGEMDGSVNDTLHDGEMDGSVNGSFGSDLNVFGMNSTDWDVDGGAKEGNETVVAAASMDYTSVAVLLTGIISSRFGLWIADLTVTQILQEEVREGDRGGVNGVQSSLNQSFSLLRSLLLVALPTIPTYGFLILASVGFVVLGMIQFGVYAIRKSSSQATPN